jgi:pyruvate/2-oxoglutarate dehydrogenase complex dihydrolipoamide dehydrogenase (E3) component
MNKNLFGDITVKDYDICVIGAGSAGLVAATTANRLGAKTALVESNKIGGECLHSGCIPSKTFLHSTNLYHYTKKLEDYGLPICKNRKPDLLKIMKHVKSVVNSLYQNENAEVYKRMGIDVYLGKNHFVSKNKLSVNGQLIFSKYFVICTGSSPLIPPIEGLKTIPYLTNINFWDLKKLPRRTLVMGAGPIGLELGQALSRIGSIVYMTIRSNKILKKEDSEIAQKMKMILQNEGIKFLINSQINRFELKDSSIKVRYEKQGKKATLEVDALVIAIGREPNIAELKLENAGVEHNKKGILVDTELKTTTDNIYACGDVIGKYLFTHAASYYANIAVNNILKTKKIQINRGIMPWVTFTDPELAHVGLTEQEAKEKHEDIKILKVEMNLGRFKTENAKGFIKIILDKKDNIVGAHALGAHAGEYIQNLTLAMQHHITVNQIAETIYPFPTFSEIVKKAFSRYLRTKT